MTEKVTDIGHLAQVQYSNPDRLNVRRAIFDFAVPKMDINEEIVNKLNLSGSESILEVGCGDGSLLVKLRKERKHKGRLIGIDISRGMFAKNQKMSDELNLNLEFFERSADNLEFEEESFEVVLSLFMIYHMPDISKALKEWSRILKKGGKLILATNSLENRRKLQLIKKLISKKIDKIVVPQFAVRFSLENGDNMLEKFFKVEEKFIYEAELKINDPKYMVDSIRSIRDLFEPLPNDEEWRRIEDIQRIEVEKEIKEKGYFSDNLKRGFFVCSKI
ncbi:methyltransferase domain-containing protein [Candidatus Micrarchaeota archaeon]|nr:methyltransferase domain-containing protein [Candidatus Micrarchaeota archaeon]